MKARQSAAVGLSVGFHLVVLSAFVLFGRLAQQAGPRPDRVIDVVDIRELLPRQSAIVPPAIVPPPEKVAPKAAPPISLPQKDSSAQAADQTSAPGLTDEAPTDGPSTGMALPSGSPPPATPPAEIEYVPQFKITEVPVVPMKEVLSRIVYPPLAAKQGIEATVFLELLIDPTGTIRKVIVLKDPGFGFAEAAQSAMSGIVCTPAKIDGRSVAVRFRYPVRFKLK
jgi:TonB family protein